MFSNFFIKLRTYQDIHPSNDSFISKNKLSHAYILPHKKKNIYISKHDQNQFMKIIKIL